MIRKNKLTKEQLLEGLEKKEMSRTDREFVEHVIKWMFQPETPKRKGFTKSKKVL